MARAESKLVDASWTSGADGLCRHLCNRDLLARRTGWPGGDNARDLSRNRGRRSISFVLVSIAVVACLMFTTAKWQDRMTDFLQGNLDASANSRLVAWGGGWNLAMEYPITGGGFDVYTDEGDISLICSPGT